MTLQDVDSVELAPGPTYKPNQAVLPYTTSDVATRGPRRTMLSLTRCTYGARPITAVHTRADCRAAQGGRPAKATSSRGLGADWRRRGAGVGVGGHGRVPRCLRRRGGGGGPRCDGAMEDTSAFTNSFSALTSEQLAERVVWLPPLRRNASASVMPDFDAATAETDSANNRRTMPFFALGQEPYLPGSAQVRQLQTLSAPPQPHPRSNPQQPRGVDSPRMSGKATRVSGVACARRRC
jgi:hypothetical protein